MEATNRLDLIIEPLCNATQQAFSPIRWWDDDYLLISADEKIERFIVEQTRAVTSERAYSHSESEPLFLHPTTGVPMYRQGFGSSDSLRRLTKRIPERQEIGFGKWKLAGTDFTALVIFNSVPQTNIVFLDEGSELLYNFLLKRFAQQTHRSRMIAKFEVSGVVPEMPKEYVAHPELPLADYQKIGLLSSLNQEATALFMEQGTGKTAIVINRTNIEGFVQRRDKGVMYKSLIICPKQCRRNWEEEFNRFSIYSGKTSVIRGGKLRRIRGLTDGIRDEGDCNWSACIISMDSVDASWEAIRKIPWDLVVIDESHGIKNPNSKRFKTARIFTTQSAKCRQRMVLTGTPYGNTLFDLWSQFEFLGKGLSGFMAYNNFRKFHGVWERRNGSPVSSLVEVRGIPLIKERLTRLAFMTTKEKAGLKLPPKVYDIYEVEMGKKQTEIYNKIATELAYEIEDMVDDGSTNKSILVENVLTKLLRLAQITSGHIKWDDMPKPEQISDRNPKVEAIIDMITDEGNDPDCKSIVWSCFDEDIRVLSLALHELGIKHVGYKPQILQEYRVSCAEEAEVVFNNDKDCKVILANPASGGSGINLLGYDRTREDEYTTYAGHVIYMSSNWSAIQRSQAEDRAHRRGTRNNVRITDVMVSGSIDEMIRDRVQGKIKAAKSIQDIGEILAMLKGFKNE